MGYEERTVEIEGKSRRHMHGDDEPHATETWGLREFTPRVVMLTLRVRPGRGETEEDREHLSRVLSKWIDRWADRRNCLYDGIQIQNVRSAVERPFGGSTLVVSWMAIGPMPTDWRCFSSVAGDTVSHAFQRPMSGLLLNLADTFALPDTDDGEEKADPIH